MSANPTRVDWDATTAEPVSTLHEGNRVLETIARQEALPALMAFSELRQQLRNRRAAGESASDRDLFETERFILDEVLQLICDRAQAITRADCVLIAFEEAPEETQSAEQRSKPELPELVCRAAAGPLGVSRGVHLIGESQFLQACLATGLILRCDDGETDARVELDFAHQLGARSTVLVPLRGRHERLGVLQAFSTTARAFTDLDVRGFDLFAELVLSALKPQDQDRRFHWLSEVASEVLYAKLTAPAPPVVNVAPIEISEIILNHLVPDTELDHSLAALTSSATATDRPSPAEAPVAELGMLTSPVAIPADLIELPETDIADELLEDETLVCTPATPAEPRRVPSLSLSSSSFSLSSLSSSFSFLRRISLPGSSLPGLSVVLGLVVVAALFSAGAWWGMQVHGPMKTVGTKDVALKTAPTNTAIPPQSITAPSVPAAEVLASVASDNLMNESKPGFDSTPLSAVAENKLAALPKITGVRHWSSSMGSTVVIDMEDQVPYEVHRLMSPERIYFDLHDTVLSPELIGKTMDVGDASLTRVRVAQPVAGVTRIVLDTKNGSNFSVSMESSPYRLVVELRGSEKSLPPTRMAASGTTSIPTTAARTVPQQAPQQNPASASASAVPVKAVPLATLSANSSALPLPARTGKFRIVLDAGHGGWDLGTVGRQGLLEKDLVLDVTQRLGKLLQARLGSEVLFTRTDDTYLPLDQRADIANQSQADLFVSVHANYSRSAEARGVETYYTNLFSAPGSREVEKHDDGTFTKPTPVALSAEGLHEKIEESQRLASSVQRSLYATLAAKSPDIRNRGIKDAAFLVLTGTTMPSILTEISFVSSPADERNLQSATYRQQIAEALYQGISRYEQSSPHAKVAQLQTSAARR